MKKLLLTFGCVLLVIIFLSSMILLASNPFNQLIDKNYNKVISIFTCTGIVAIVSVLISEAMENKYVEKEKKEDI